jgi:benzodiazapine receptor
MTTLSLPRNRQLIGLAGWLTLCFSTAGVGAVASVNAKAFYSGLAQPSWAPQDWLFGPVWTLLFAMMAVAAWLVLWGLIALTCAAFWSIRPLAGVLVPYLAWVAFASCLNWMLWQTHPALLG